MWNEYSSWIWLIFGALCCAVKVKVIKLINIIFPNFSNYLHTSSESVPWHHQWLAKYNPSDETFFLLNDLFVQVSGFCESTPYWFFVNNLCNRKKRTLNPYFYTWVMDTLYNDWLYMRASTCSHFSSAKPITGLSHFWAQEVMHHLFHPFFCKSRNDAKVQV